MKAQKITALLAAVILLTCATAAQEAEKTAKKEISNTRIASCLVKVTCDPAVLPLSFETIEYLMHSSGVAGRAAAEVLGPRDEPYECDQWFSIEPLDPHSAGRPGRPYGGVSQGRPYGVSEPDEDAKVEFSQRAMKYDLDERALKELEMFQRTSRFRSKRYDKEQEPELKKPRYRARWTQDTPGKIARGRNRESAAAAPSTAERTLLLRLQIDLEDREVKPAAEEFMNALIDNLRHTLRAAFDAYRNELADRVQTATGARERAQDEFSKGMGLTEADLATKKQLDETVDLSAFGPEMALGDALEVLKNSVDPPLRIVVLWRDLLEEAEVDQATAINMDPISAIPVGKALELLLKSVSAGTADLGYKVEESIITIAARENLPTPQRKFSQITQMDIPVEILHDRKYELLREKQHLEINIASSEARWLAIEEQIARINDEITAKTKADPISLELQRLVDLNVRQLERAKKALDNGKRVTGVDEVAEKIARAKIDLAKRREELSRSDGGEQLAKLSRRLTELMIELPEKKAQLQVISKQLEQTEGQLQTASAFDPQISQIRLAKEALEVAQRRLNELETCFVNLSEPTVTVLGGI